MAEQDNLGDLGVNITGDYSELQSAIDEATQAATAGAQTIADAFNVPDNGTALAESIDGVSNATVAAGDQLSLFGGEVQDASAQMDLFDTGAIAAADSMQQIGDGAATATPELNDLGDAAGHAGEGANEAEGGVAALSEQVLALGEALVATEALKEFGQEALTAYGTVQSVTIGLTQLTGSAEQANEIIEQIKTLAATEPFAFPEIAPTVQKMVALGVSAEAIPGVMQAAADAAAATGNSFQQVANSFDRMSLSGNVSARALTQLGISTADVASAMDVTSTEVKKAFAALDQSQRIEVLQTALEKFAGSAEAQAQGISGQWQLFQNQFEEVMVAVGAALAPVVGDILSFGKDVMAGVQQAVEVFNTLPAPVKDVVVSIGLLAAAIVPVTAAVAGLGFAIIGVQTAIATFQELLVTLGATAEATAVAEEAAAAATVELGTAAAGAAALGTDAVAAEAGVVGLGGSLLAMGGYVAGAVAAWELFKTAGVFDSLTQLKQAIADNSTNLQQMEKVVSDWNAQIGESVKDVLSQFIDLKNSVTDLLPPIQNVTTAILPWKSAIDLAAVSLQNLSGVVPGMAANIQDMLNGLQAVPPAFAYVKAGADDMSKGLLALVSAQNDANVKLQNARQVLADAKAALDAGTISQSVYNTALINFGKAQDAANVQLKDAKDSVAALTAAMVDAQSKFQNLVTVYNQIKAASDGSTQSVALMAEAYTKVEAAAKAAGTTFNDTLANMEKLTAAAQAQQNALVNATDTWSHLNDLGGETVTQQIAIASAFSQVQATATKLGLSVQQVGDQLLFTANNGTPAMQQLAAAMNQAYGSAIQLVDVNGKLTPTLQSLADAGNTAAAAHSNLAAAATAVGPAVDNTNRVIVGFDGTLTTTADLANKVTTAMNAMASSAVSAAQSFAQATSAGNTLANAEGDWIAQDNAAGSWASQDSAAASGKGGKGGAGGSMSPEEFSALGVAAYEDPQLSQFVSTTPMGSVFTDWAANIAAFNNELDTARGAVGTFTSSFQTAVQSGPWDTWNKEAALNSTAVASNTTAVTTNTSATVAATTATTAAITSTSALASVNTALGTSFTDTASALQEVEKLIGETVSSPVLQTSLWNLASSLNQVNAPLQVIAYSGTTAGTALGSLTTATADTTSSLSSLSSTAASGTATWADYNNAAQQYTDQVNAGTLSASDAASALGQLAQQILNTDTALAQNQTTEAQVSSAASNVAAALTTMAQGVQNADGSFTYAFNTISGSLVTLSTETQLSAQALANFVSKYNTVEGKASPTTTTQAASPFASGTQNADGSYTYAYDTLSGNPEVVTSIGQMTAAALAAYIAHVNTVGGTVANLDSAGYGVGLPSSVQSTFTGFPAPTSTTYTAGNPMPVSIANPQPGNLTLNFTGNQTIGDAAISQLATLVQQKVVTVLRQAGLKI